MVEMTSDALISLVGVPSFIPTMEDRLRYDGHNLGLAFISGARLNEPTLSCNFDAETGVASYGILTGADTIFQLYSFSNEHLTGVGRIKLATRPILINIAFNPNDDEVENIRRTMDQEQYDENKESIISSLSSIDNLAETRVSVFPDKHELLALDSSDFTALAYMLISGKTEALSIYAPYYSDYRLSWDITMRNGKVTCGLF